MAKSNLNWLILIGILVLAILFFNTGAVFSIIFILATIKSDLKHLSKKFDSLVSDFKGHLKEHN